MAKGSAMGLWRGKKGSSVFYKIKNSNSAQKQGIRERVYEVSNPQTYGQANQRMKMLPAQRMATALRSVIYRGFEGIPYGVRSRQEFLKYALAMTSGYPAVSKNDAQLYPGQYIISRGSLPSVGGSLSSGGSLFVTNLRLPAEQTFTNVGGFSQALLDNNSQLKAGQQVTFVICGADDAFDTGIFNFNWIVASLVLDVNDTRNFEEVDPAFGEDITISNDTIGGIRMLAIGDDSKDIIAAAGIIISEESASGQHLRSTCQLNVSPDFDFLFEPAQLATARRSYMKNNSAVATDWPVEPLNEINGQEFTETDIVVRGLPAGITVNVGTKAKVFTSVEDGAVIGYPYILQGTDKLVVSPSGSTVTANVTEGEETVQRPLKVSEYPALNGLVGLPYTQAQ